MKAEPRLAPRTSVKPNEADEGCEKQDGREAGMHGPCEECAEDDGEACFFFQWLQDEGQNFGGFEGL